MNRNSKHILSRAGLLLVAVLIGLGLGGCVYDSLPPKTDDSNSNYVVPKGTIPSDQEKALLEAIRAEYESNTSNK